ncbi:MAG TPA: response regulator transcription factor [Candidatus Dormibacteraeota bacterium]
MADPVRLLLVDDHAVVREGLRAFLRLVPGLEVVGDAADGASAVAAARSLRPDVVLLDLVMPGGDGVAALRLLRTEVPQARVLVLTSFTDDAQIFAAMEAGAAGYLLKDVEPDALVSAVRAVAAGDPALHPRVATRLMRRGVALEPRLVELTPRERDVLRLIVEGLANKEIARRLGIGEKTVKTHVSRVLDKLGAADRTQAAVVALRTGMVE